MSSAITLDDLVENAFHLIEQGYYNACPRRASRRRSSFEGALSSHPTFPIIAEVKLSTPMDGTISTAHLPISSCLTLTVARPPFPCSPNPPGSPVTSAISRPARRQKCPS